MASDLFTNFPLDDSELAHLKKRQRQLALAMLFVFCGTTVVYTLQSRWDVVVILVPAALSMLVCLAVNDRYPERAGFLMWFLTFVAIASLILSGEGLKDATVSALPLILLAGGQMLRPKYFLGLTLSIVGLVVFIGLGHIFGYFHMGVIGNDRDRLMIQIIVLSLSAMLVFAPAYDMRRAMSQLKSRIEQAKQTESHLRFLSQHDPLTQLPNRILSAQMFEQAIAKEGRESSRLALMFVDVDNFKNVNDSLGHAAGDEFLTLVAQRLRASVRSSDIVCRQGGDEFLVGLTGVVDDASVSQVAHQVLQQISVPFELPSGPMTTTCSVGIAIYPDDGTNFEDLLRLADLAMYQAKSDGRNMFRFYNAEIQSHARRNLAMLSALRLALDHNEFELYYQPIVELETTRVVGAEALIRWVHPVDGLISPAHFIPEAERSGLIIDIGAWVIRAACKQIRAWQDEGIAFERISINISPVQFRRGNLGDVLSRALSESGISPSSISLEIVESALLDESDRFLNTLQGLRNMGATISIDDFGTGYSNLRYLQRYQVETLKIDKSFVDNVHLETRGLALMSAMVQMARSMDMGIVAEGVETTAQRDTLLGLGCTCAQGYFFAKPMPAHEFVAFAWHGDRASSGAALEHSSRPWASSHQPSSQGFKPSQPPQA